jgi:hypothetical protein
MYDPPVMDGDTAADIKRYFGIVAEDLKSEIRIVAEGQVLLVERMDRLEGKIDHLDHELQEVRR